VISPLLGGVLSLYLFSLIRDRVLYSPRPLEATKTLTPYFVFVLTFLLFLTLLLTGNDHLGFDIPIPSLIAIVLVLSISGAFLSNYFVQKVNPEVDQPIVPSSYQPEVIIGLGKARKHLMRVEAHSDGEVRNRIHALMHEVAEISQGITQGPFQEVIHTHLKWVEIIFSKLQIFSACIMAFAHGSNDVANAIGPMTGSIRILLHQQTSLQADVPKWALALGGLGIVVGLATWGWRVILTIGKKITELTPTRGFSAELSAALVVLFASKLGLPISATHTLVGAVLGVGLARGLGAINLSITRDILASWVVTVPAGAILCILFYSILDLFIKII
jgi:phosphate/sulfate permease